MISSGFGFGLGFVISRRSRISSVVSWISLEDVVGVNIVLSFGESVASAVRAGSRSDILRFISSISACIWLAGKGVGGRKGKKQTSSNATLRSFSLSLRFCSLRALSYCSRSSVGSGGGVGARGIQPSVCSASEAVISNQVV